METKKDYVIKEENKEKRGWHLKRVESTVDDVWIELCTKYFIDIHSGKIVRKNYDIYIEDGQLVTTLKISSWEGLSNRANRTENGPNPNTKKGRKDIPVRRSTSIFQP